MKPVKYARKAKLSITTKTDTPINTQLVESVVGSPLLISDTSVVCPAYVNLGIDESPLILDAGIPNSHVPSSETIVLLTGFPPIRTETCFPGSRFQFLNKSPFDLLQPKIARAPES